MPRLLKKRFGMPGGKSIIFGQSSIYFRLLVHFGYQAICKHFEHIIAPIAQLVNCSITRSSLIWHHLYHIVF